MLNQGYRQLLLFRTEYHRSIAAGHAGIVRSGQLRMRAVGICFQIGFGGQANYLVASVIHVFCFIYLSG